MKARRAMLLVSPLLLAASATSLPAQVFVPGDLVVSTSTYEDTGDISNLNIGDPLPGGGTAVATGAYPSVFANEGPDPSFGVTSPIILQDVSTSGVVESTFDVSTSLLTTSFPSKSELALNLTPDGTALTFMGYVTPAGSIDTSNSNTPAIIEPGNPVTTTPTYRAVAQIDSFGNIVTTTTNAYSGNNGRAAIEANGFYFAVGNAGNGNGSSAVTAATGVQLIIPGQNATSSSPGTQNVGSYNITQDGYKADKSAKDNNYRGETVFDNTLYVTKGSGSNGIDTVYQVGTVGGLSSINASNAASQPISILPGFTKALAKPAASPTNPASNPFGLFFANPNTLYVADEGDGSLADLTNGNDPNSGLQKWSLVSGVWQLDYVLKNGLNLGTKYSVSGLPTSLNPAADGLRNLTGVVNANGSVTLYAITSTVSAATDQGADPNQLVAITDDVNATTLPTSESFSVLETAANGQVLRGVSFAPIPEPSTYALIAGAACASFVLFRRLRRPAAA